MRGMLELTTTLLACSSAVSCIRLVSWVRYFWFSCSSRGAASLKETNRWLASMQAAELALCGEITNGAKRASFLTHWSEQQEIHLNLKNAKNSTNCHKNLREFDTNCCVLFWRRWLISVTNRSQVVLWREEWRRYLSLGPGKEVRGWGELTGCADCDQWETCSRLDSGLAAIEFRDEFWAWTRENMTGEDRWTCWLSKRGQ